VILSSRQLATAILSLLEKHCNTNTQNRLQKQQHKQQPLIAHNYKQNSKYEKYDSIYDKGLIAFQIRLHMIGNP